MISAGPATSESSEKSPKAWRREAGVRAVGRVREPLQAQALYARISRTSCWQHAGARRIGRRPR